MDNHPKASTFRTSLRLRADMIYAVCLFVLSLFALWFVDANQWVAAGEHGWPSILLLFVFGLYTITVGFPHPGFGHVSFDRVGQVAAVLLVGPLHAACLCGAASFAYPWKRLLHGEPLRLVLLASLHNAGLMTLVVLGGGLLYVGLGGPVPLVGLNLSIVGHLLVLVFSMQFLNDIGMLLIFRFRGQNPAALLTLFTTAVEIGSALIAILVALVVSGRDVGVIVLLLFVLSLGMLVLKRYAEMRSRLEALVDERTEELRQKSLELEHQATRDKLTGLYNRHFADDFLARQIEQARRSGGDFAIALADVDQFKRINDEYSHAIGDQVLAQIADILQRRCRQTDVVARYGGEEFLLCFPDTNSIFAEQICEQLRHAIEECDWPGALHEHDAPMTDIRVTMSFGVASVQDDSRPSSLLNEADTRLYRAKNGGRNRVVV